MTITAILYNAGANIISKTEINSGHIGIINYLVNGLEPEEQGLCIRVAKTQINVEPEFVGYFVEYAVTIEDKTINTPCERFYFDSTNEVNEFINEYLTNLIETERAWV